MRPSTIARAAVVAVAFAATAGCWKDPLVAPTTRDTSSLFNATVTGALTETIVGEAFGGTAGTTASGPLYELILSKGPFASSVSGVVFQHVGAAVVTGTYPLAPVKNSDPTAFYGGYFTTTGAKGNDTYYTKSGTLTISAISGSRVTGSFDAVMQTTDTTLTTQLTLHVVGTFDGTNESLPASRSPLETPRLALLPR